MENGDLMNEEGLHQEPNHKEGMTIAEWLRWRLLPAKNQEEENMKLAPMDGGEANSDEGRPGEGVGPAFVAVDAVIASASFYYVYNVFLEAFRVWRSEGFDELLFGEWALFDFTVAESVLLLAAMWWFFKSSERLISANGSEEKAIRNAHILLYITYVFLAPAVLVAAKTAIQLMVFLFCSMSKDSPCIEMLWPW